MPSDPELERLISDQMAYLNPPVPGMMPDYVYAAELGHKISQRKQKLLTEGLRASLWLINNLGEDLERLKSQYAAASRDVLETAIDVISENDSEFDRLTRDLPNDYDVSLNNQIAEGLRAAQRMLADKVDHNHPDFRTYIDACAALSKRDLNDHL